MSNPITAPAGFQRVPCEDHEHLLEVSGILERGGWRVVEKGSTLTETNHRMRSGGATVVLWAPRA